MSKVNINISTDDSVKKDFESFCLDMGMDMNTAFNLFMKKTIEEHKVPFAIGGDSPNSETIEAFREADRIRNGEVDAKRYSDVTEFFDEVLI